MLDIDAILRPWYESIEAAHGPFSLFDAHTHIGANDPDGFKQTPAELIEVMSRAGSRAVVFPMHEPDGYPGPNDVAISAAAESDGRLVAFCRLDPRDHPAAEARRCLDAGAVGIKLHPRAEQFTMSEPGVREIVAVAHERRVPILIHAGRGIPALGRDTVELSSEFPDARLILAHAAISDLAWLWHVLPEHPNVFIDTAWWNPADHIALFSLVAPSQIVWASDSPYGLPLLAAWCHMRSALQAGVSDEALRSIMGGQIARLVAGEDPLWVGDAPGAPSRRAAPAARSRRHAHDLGDGARVRRRRPDRVPGPRAAVLRGRRGRPARRRLLGGARVARPVPQAPRTAAAGAPVPARGALHHRRADGRAHAGRAAARPTSTCRRRRAKRRTPER